MAAIVKENALREHYIGAADSLKNGEIAVYPTETSYGLGCIISARASVERIFVLKKRPKSQPLPVIAADMEMMGEYAVMTHSAEKLAEAFMPGPLMLLLQRTRKVPEWFPGEKIGIRVPGGRTARELCKIAGMPIVSTSANISGERQYYEISKVRKSFERKAGLIIDAGDLQYNKPSTIYDVEHSRVVREGNIRKEQIEEALGK